MKLNCCDFYIYIFKIFLEVTIFSKFQTVLFGGIFFLLYLSFVQNFIQSGSKKNLRTSKLLYKRAMMAL